MVEIYQILSVEEGWELWMSYGDSAVAKGRFRTKKAATEEAQKIIEFSKLNEEISQAVAWRYSID